MGLPFSPDEDSKIAQMRQAGESWDTIGRAVNRSSDSVRKHFPYIKAQSPNPAYEQAKSDIKESALERKVKRLEIELANAATGNRSFTVQPEYEYERTPQQRWECAEADSRERIAKATQQGKATITLPNEVFGVSYVSDQHIGPGTPCDMKRMREDAELIADTPGLYALCMGDGVDNHIKHRSAMLNSRSQPGEQYKLYEYYLSIFADSIIGLCSGNHDDWTKQFAGIDVVGEIAKQHRVFYAPDEVHLTVKAGNQEYKISGRHQYKMSSSLNQGHSPKQWLRFGDKEFDVGGMGHHHEAHIETYLFRGLIRWICRPGSYQITSQYSRQFGFNDSVPSCPTFVFWPNERRIVGFHDVREAVDYLKFQRAKHQ